MCFSAEASFTGAAVLAVAGGYLVNKFRSTRYLLLALTPCLFAIQQFSEGVLWEALTHNQYPSWWGMTAQQVFLFFALALWPLWMPIVFFVSETQQWRRRAMAVCIALGALFFCNNLFKLFSEEITAEVIYSSINYGPESPFLYRLAYAAIALVPCFISSISRMWIVGLVITVAFFACDYLYYYAFTSVWCCFSAITTIGLLLVLKKEEVRQET